MKTIRELVAGDLDHNWMFDVYLGLLPIVAMTTLLVVGPRESRIRMVTGGAAAIVVLALATGGPLLAFSALHVPGFGLFRIAYRYKTLLALVFSIGGADACAALLRTKGATLTFVAISVMALATSGLLGSAFANLALASVPLILFGAVLYWRDRAQMTPSNASPSRLSGQRAVPVLLGATALSVCVELIMVGQRKMNILQERPSIEAAKATLRGLEDTTREWRYHVSSIHLPYGGPIPYHVAYLFHAREFSGYGNPIVIARQVELAQRATRTPAILQHFGVRYYAGAERPGHAVPIAQSSVRAVAPEAVAPWVKFYDAATVLSDDDALQLLATRGPRELQTALLASPLPGVPSARIDGSLPGAPVQVEIRNPQLRRNRLSFEIIAPTRGLVIVNEMWYPGWFAYIDDIPTPIVRANYALRAVAMPAGHHRVVMKFQPPWQRTLLVLHGLALVLCLWLMLRNRAASDRQSLR